MVAVAAARVRGGSVACWQAGRSKASGLPGTTEGGLIFWGCCSSRIVVRTQTFIILILASGRLCGIRNRKSSSNPRGNLNGVCFFGGCFSMAERPAL